MGIVTKGANGLFLGKVGFMVSYMLNGQQVVRSMPDRPKRKPTPLALINQTRMKVSSQFLRPLKHILEFGYQYIAPKGSRVGTFQAAQSYVFKNALDYHEDGMPYVNPEKVLVFRGPLAPPQNLTVSRDGNVLNFSWLVSDNSILVLLAYSEDSGLTLFNEHGPKAEAGNFSWDTKVNEPAHIYASYYHMIGNKLSDSVYVGLA